MSTGNPSNLPQSPMKGIDRISEELRQERQKVSQLQQERSKLKIEIETLKQSIESFKSGDEDSQNQLYHLKKQIQEQGSLIESLHSEISFYKDTIQHNEQEKKELESALEQLEQDNEGLHELMQQQKEDMLSLQFKIDTSEKKQSSKDELINSLKQELLSVRQSHLHIEKENLETLNAASNQQSLQDELNSSKELIKELEKTLDESKDNNDQLLHELTQSLSLNSTYQKQVEELNTKMIDIHSREKQLLQTIDQLMNDKDLTTKDSAQFEETTHQLQQTLQLERESSQVLRDRNDSLLEKNHFLEKQLYEVKDLYEKTLQSNLLLEENYHQLKVLNLKCQEEIMEDRERMQELELQLQQNNVSGVMKQEIETLRNQLQVMRKKVIQQDLEQETGVFQSQQIMDREQQGRQVYENIIHDLRAEIDKMNHKYNELLQKYNETHMKAARVDQLEEEVIMYKEMAKHITVEKQTVAMNASEAVERNVKTAHENHHLLTTVHRLENEIKNYQIEIQTNQTEMTNLREKMKQFHHHQLTAERKATELLSVNSKLQGQYEDMKQEYEILSLDYEKQKRHVADYLQQIASLQSSAVLQEKLQQENELLQQKYQQSQILLNQKETQSRKELDLMKSQKEMITQELETIQKTIPIKEKTIYEVTSQLNELREAYDDLLRQKEIIQQELMQMESRKNEETLQQLKQDMNQTLEEFEELEKEKLLKQQIISTLTTNLEKEKEKNVLLTMQMNLLEEKVKVLQQEVDVYHGLDVYHTTKQQELLQYRQSQQPGSPRRGGIAEQVDSDRSNPENSHQASRQHQRLQKLFVDNPESRIKAIQRKERRSLSRSKSPQKNRPNIARTSSKADADAAFEESSVVTIDEKRGRLSMEDMLPPSQSEEEAEEETKRYNDRELNKEKNINRRGNKGDKRRSRDAYDDEDDAFIRTPPPPPLPRSAEDSEDEDDDDDDYYSFRPVREEEARRYPRDQPHSRSNLPTTVRPQKDSNLLKQSFAPSHQRASSASRYNQRLTSTSRDTQEDFNRTAKNQIPRPSPLITGNIKPRLSSPMSPSSSFLRPGFSSYGSSEKGHTPDRLRPRTTVSPTTSHRQISPTRTVAPVPTTVSSSDSTDSLSVQQRARRKELREKLMMEKILLEEKSKQLQQQREEQQKQQSKSSSINATPSTSNKPLPYHPYAFDDDPNDSASTSSFRGILDARGSITPPPSVLDNLRTARQRREDERAKPDRNYIAEVLSRGRSGVDLRTVPEQISTSVHLMNNKYDLDRAKRILSSSTINR